MARIRHANHRLLFDNLESRLLLSQTPLPISVSYANTTLTSETAPGQIAPSFSSGTDFRYASSTAPGAIGQITRTFTITNTSNATLPLGNVTLTGTNAADFSIVSALPSSLDPNTPATLTLAFNPTATGTRTATLTIPDASNIDAPFLFDIQGTGLATTNFPNGLEVATVQAGSGNATASNGDVLSISYAGYLLNGFLFDASPANNPFALILDNTPTRDFIGHNPNFNLIDGWEQGLQGMKEGESRILIIPSSLGYGVNGSPPKIPSNAPLVFETFLNELDYAPEVGIRGTDNAFIPSGTSTANLTHGTDFGTIPPGQSSISHTFSIVDFSNATDDTGNFINRLNYNNMTVTLSGPNASDFFFAGGNPITVANGTPVNGNFTITFSPTGTGTRTATVHLHSNDAFNPDYTFTIQGTNTRAIALSANNLSIPNAEADTNINNFTDFSYQSLSPNDAVTRTFTITNAGTSTLSLGNVSITGANPADFSIASPPALSSLAPSQSTSFTIQFNPSAAGTRAAIVNVTSDALGNPFTFAVSGTGVATTTPPSNVRYATLQPANTTIAAANGELLQISFQAEPTTGTYFSGSASFRLDNVPGHPFINNDQSPANIKNAYDFPQIDGWENGLQGIKAGETRLLFLPASQTVGASANGSLLPNQPLIYLVTCNALAYGPALGVSGNGITIAPGASAPNADDGTDFGTLTGTQSSTAHSFSVFNNSFADDANGNLGANLSFGGLPAISFSGQNPSDFLVSSNPGIPGLYTVTFRPTGTGLRTATIHFASNDPQSPDYSFPLQGINNASPDLQLTLDTTSFPTTRINTNTATTLTLPIRITNVGAASTATGTTDIQIFAHNTATNTNTLLAAYPALTVALTPNGGVTYSLNAPIPLTLPTGTYTLLASINQSAAISDPNPTNDSATTPQTFSVNAVYTNLTPHVLSSTLPRSARAKTPLAGTITFNIANTGTLPLPKTQQAAITLLARNTTGATIPLLTLKPQSLANLKPNAVVRITSPTFKLPAGLPAGTYSLLVRIAPTPRLAQSSAADDTAASAFALSITPPTYDLTGTLNSSTLKSSPKGVAGAVNLTVRTLGNSNLPATQKVQLQVLAHPAAAADGSGNIVLGSRVVSIANLSPQKPLNFTLNIATNKVLKAGVYRVQVRIVPVPHVAETNLLNNLLAQRILNLVSTNK
ncbi:MAG: choice-of-anchor D domain-containing protein [Phycisphaerae bacterium]